MADWLSVSYSAPQQGASPPLTWGLILAVCGALHTAWPWVGVVAWDQGLWVLQLLPHPWSLERVRQSVPFRRASEGSLQAATPACRGGTAAEPYGGKLQAWHCSWEEGTGPLHRRQAQWGRRERRWRSPLTPAPGAGLAAVRGCGCAMTGSVAGPANCSGTCQQVSQSGRQTARPAVKPLPLTGHHEEGLGTERAENGRQPPGAKWIEGFGG